MNRRITLTHSENSIVLSNAHVILHPGDTLTIWLFPPVNPSSARTSAVKGPSWLNASNGAQEDRIVIQVDEETPGLYKYAIEIDDVGSLDPYIQVVL